MRPFVLQFKNNKELQIINHDHNTKTPQQIKNHKEIQIITRQHKQKTTTKEKNIK